MEDDGRDRNRNAVAIVLAVVAGCAMVGIGALVVTVFFRTSAKPKADSLGLGAHVEYKRIPMEGDPDYTGTTTPQFGGTGPIEPRRAYVSACGHAKPPPPGLGGVDGVHPYTADDAEQYAHIIRKDDDNDYHITSSIDLMTGKIEADPDDERLEAMGRRSTVAVCVVSPYNKHNIGPRVDCTPHDPVHETDPYILYQQRVEVTVVDLLSGRFLGTGELKSPPAKCTPETDKTEQMTVSDEQVADWVTKGLADGTLK